MSGLADTAAPEWNSFAVVVLSGRLTPNSKPARTTTRERSRASLPWSPRLGRNATALAIIPSTYRDFMTQTFELSASEGSSLRCAATSTAATHPLEAIVGAVQAFAGDCAWLIYSSPHSRPGDRRWRVILPMGSALAFAGWYDCQLAFFGHMESGGIKMDHALARAGQPVYLPNVPPVHIKSGTALHGGDGAPLYFVKHASSTAALGLSMASHPLASRVTAIRKRRAADDAERERIRQESAMRRAQKPQDANDNIIAAFNATNSIAVMLELCGYEQSPRSAEDWRSPHQTGETYATRIIDDKWVSLSQSDAAARLGRQCKSGCFGDAYDLYVHYKHGGDHKSAFRALRREQRAEVAHSTRVAAWSSRIPTSPRTTGLRTSQLSRFAQARCI